MTPKTLRTDMIQTLRAAPSVLGDATSQVASFIQHHQHSDGGYCGRSHTSDLYYTVFGLEAAWALQAPIETEQLHNYLNSFGDGDGLDLVHLAALTRCWATLADISQAKLDPILQSDLAEQLALSRSADSGYNTGRAEAFGSAYGNFLALGAYQDIGIPIPDIEQFTASTLALKQKDGSFTNDRSSGPGSTPATAAALCVLHYLDQPIPDQSIAWLHAQAHPQGGFTAVPTGGVTATTDLLSTATALFALNRCQVNLDSLRDITLDFCDTLWNPDGGFAGHILDPTLDCEYTYYGLLALGCIMGGEDD